MSRCVCHTRVEMCLPCTCLYVSAIHMSRCVCHTHVEMCLPYTYQHVYGRQTFPGKYILLFSTENHEIVFRANDVLTRRRSHGTGGQAPVSQHGIHERFVEDRVALQHVFLRTPLCSPLSKTSPNAHTLQLDDTVHYNHTN